jgi:FlaA1/EpsC-like NDP-sugar epimerase
VIAKSSSLPQKIVARLRRDIPLVLLDIAVLFATYLACLVLRFDGAVPERYWENFREFIPVVAFLHLLANYFFGLYGQMWRYASVQEARRLLLAGASAAVCVIVAAKLLGGRITPLPLSVMISGAALSVMGFGAIRFQSRLFAFRRRTILKHQTRVLIVGAGDAGAMVLRDILRDQDLGLLPVALLDDDVRKRGRFIHGVPVLGGAQEIPALVARLEVDEVLLAIPSATSEVVREVAELCEEADVTLRVLPTVGEILNDKVTARDIRDLRIEDLLGRQQVETDLESVRSILADRRVLVTGAGGSIGSEIVRQVMTYGPAGVIMLDHDETHLHDVEVEADGGVPVHIVLADIRDPDAVFRTFATHRPQVVFHAAAHKHVPILETHPAEAVMTNVIGTATVADAAASWGAERFVLISTDKAIRPASVMGASKWFAEQLVRSLDGNGCVMCAVRFGNVLGSRGSVIPTFLKQIRHGGPVTVTDPEMTRYFMSVQESVQLVLQAAALSGGGEVFTLDMGEPVKISELARKLIRLSGRVPGKDVPIDFVGVRPGEKLIEDIVDISEEPLPSAHPSIVVSRPDVPDRTWLRRAVKELEMLAHAGRGSELALLMKGFAVRTTTKGEVDLTSMAVGEPL